MNAGKDGSNDGGKGNKWDLAPSSPLALPGTKEVAPAKGAMRMAGGPTGIELIRVQVRVQLACDDDLECAAAA